MKFRHHHGSLVESMETCVEVEPTLQALERSEGQPFPTLFDLAVKLELYEKSII